MVCEQCSWTVTFANIIVLNTRKQLSENSRTLSWHNWFRSWLRWCSLLIQKLQLSCCLVQEPEGNQRKYQWWRIDRGSVLRKVSWGSIGKLTDNVHLASTIELCNLDLIIIITEICKAPTLRLKALNKHSITHIIKYIEMEDVISNNNNKQQKSNT